MGSPCSRPYYSSSARPLYLCSPSENLSFCYGTPDTCCCPTAHRSPRYMISLPNGGGRCRYVDPMMLIDRPGVGAGGVVHQQNGCLNQNFFGGAEMGGFGGLGWKDPKDWTTRDFDCLAEVLEECAARQRGRRRRHGREYWDDDDDVEGGREGVDYRDVMALLGRLSGVENTLYGSESEMRDAAFRARLARIAGGGGGGDGEDGGSSSRIGRGGGREGERFARHQRDLERREREQRRIDRRLDDIGRHYEGMRG